MTEILSGIEVIFLDKGTAKTIVLVISVIGFIGAAIAILGGLARIFFGGTFLTEAGAGVLGALGGATGVFMIVIGIIQFWIYFKLMKFVSWARIVVIIFAVLSLFSFPIGTILGILIIYFLGFNKDIRQLFK
jgi:hypothetical protein